MDSIAIILAVVVAGCLLAWPRLASAPLWRASVTPLASIIGSGFLVNGPAAIGAEVDGRHDMRIVPGRFTGLTSDDLVL